MFLTTIWTGREVTAKRNLMNQDFLVTPSIGKSCSDKNFAIPKLEITKLAVLLNLIWTISEPTVSRSLLHHNLEPIEFLIGQGSSKDNLIVRPLNKFSRGGLPLALKTYRLFKFNYRFGRKHVEW